MSRGIMVTLFACMAHKLPDITNAQDISTNAAATQEWNKAKRKAAKAMRQGNASGIDFMCGGQDFMFWGSRNVP